MDTDLRHLVKKELLEDDYEVRSFFSSHFESEISAFINVMAQAYHSWIKYDSTVRTNRRRAYVSAFLFNAFNNLLASMKLFISGYSIPSGNLVRQTIESICSAILCSIEKLQIYQQIDQNKFSSKNAGKLVLKYSKTFNIDQKAMQSLMKLYEFYHKFSHTSLLALAHNISFSNIGRIYVGPSFDDKKMFAYRKEVSSRVNLAKTISNVIEGILVEQEKHS
jgi:hypothetical protein